MFLSSVPTLRRKKGTEKLVPVTCAHAEEEEGYREACSCHLCPRCDGREAQKGVRLVYGNPTLLRAMHPMWATDVLATFQNAELPAYAVPCRRCLSEDVDIF